MADTFIESNCVTLGKDLVVDGTAEVLTAVEDMSGYDEIVFLVKHGDVDPLAVMTYTMKENTTNSTSGGTAITGTVVAGTGATISTGALTITEASGNLDDKIIILTASHSALSKRYVFLSITCTVESHEIDSIITIKRRAKSLPVTQSSDVACSLQATS